jgi:hypothetical protein
MQVSIDSTARQVGRCMLNASEWKFSLDMSIESGDDDNQ